MPSWQICPPTCHISGVSLTCIGCPFEMHARKLRWVEHSCTFVNLLRAVQQGFIVVDQMWALSQMRTM